ncbi:MAG TPA: aminodeoxychorismate synthase component I [Pseudomonadales bacterium]|nr:aminodeoxychorismate synthase component I [Pseudomonadales bacterium]
MDLPYASDPLPLLAALRPLGRPVLLQSAQPGHPQSRFDILSAAPTRTIETRGDISILQRDGAVTESTRPPFELLEDMLAACAAPVPDPDLPFSGGLLGLAGYDLARRLEVIGDQGGRDTGFPDLIAGLYEWALVTDHRRRRTRLVCLPGARVPAAVHAALAQRPAVPAIALPTLVAETDRAAYGQAFERVQEYIHAGDCYQINLAIRFHARTDADPLGLYAALLARHPAPFAGYLETPAGAVLSLSPERLLHCDGQRLTSSPIKGTRPRGADPASDLREREALQASAKDRAENLMIVDLLRNDLGRSSLPGSIRVPALFELQSFGSVHHLVSTIEGRLRPEVSPIAAFAAAFPGGSITGAPKVRAMQIIEALEGARRGPYCGSLFRIDASGRMDASITIRSLLHSGGDLWCWGGGGIVVDSDVDAEWAEIHAKVGALVNGDRPQAHVPRGTPPADSPTRH